MKVAAAMGTVAALLTAGLVTPPAAEAASVRILLAAERRPYYDNGRYDRRRAFDYGVERGRREGAEQGYNDGRRHRDFDFWREGEYRDGDAGYKGWMGSRREYEQGFRRGYETAYRQSYASARPGWRDRSNWRDRNDRYRDDDRDWR